MLKLGFLYFVVLGDLMADLTDYECYIEAAESEIASLQAPRSTSSP